VTAVFWQAIVKAGGISILPFFYYISCSNSVLQIQCYAQNTTPFYYQLFFTFYNFCTNTFIKEFTT
jgi:hypothetical protein